MKKPQYRGTGINVYQQSFKNLVIGDTFFDTGYGRVIWNGRTWQINDLLPRTSYIEGDLVTYIPFEGCEEDSWENGIVKEMKPNSARVVYHCGDEWENFREYTSALTDIKQLRRGWITKTNEIL